ncbi:uncharacterized protein LAESUDRAFT_713572 [Laetiporus sulphureus 93-53]|uniref:Ricin B lectin domain-containing protein n=1 Tax=Laetiporus sulphureus 93-53 TaxID=1314785 RepID=A0A165EP52_9APHY|nr:uncharacterized protein LAESUDRAFT_713572 [Laetiporus sulphureus 93-53]KZT07471.1 hypothetical protein LAESUDRAFT_713572 [Laetiporus sulphureus 93-53]
MSSFIEIDPSGLSGFTITNQLYDVVAPDRNAAGILASGSTLTPVVVTVGAQAPVFRLEKLDNGAYHILLSGLEGVPRLVVASQKKLYAQEDTLGDSTDLNQEWEVLSTAREGTSTDDAHMKGVYMIAVRGQPRMVWTLRDGATGTQVEVLDIFTANGPDSVLDESIPPATAATRGSEPIWKPRRWLWHIRPSKQRF